MKRLSLHTTCPVLIAIGIGKGMIEKSRMTK